MSETHATANTADSWAGTYMGPNLREHPQIPKPFSDYTAEDWDTYHEWAASNLRSEAAAAETHRLFSPAVIQKMQDAADWHESQLGGQPH
ncbi:hypothetical protein [Amycolatopsis sp. NPDC004079]|uniref:hypothetical protein n=1 Tax=Amycolatopsis sp. NPDC004079 TaxID=3154549 RepID=UPI0033A11DF8